MSKIIVPLHLANLYSTPNGVDTGFKKFYLKSGWLKLYDGASEIDVVLDRPLDGYNPTNGVISPSDTVLSAIEKLGYGISYITNPQWGTISGNILSQADLLLYLSDNYYPLLSNPANYITQQSVLEYPNLASFPTTGVTNTIYIAIDTDIAYYWDGSAYVVITGSTSGITGFGIVNRLAKFTPTGSAIGSSKIIEFSGGATIINSSNRNFLDGNSIVSIQRPQSQIDFILGNPALGQSSFLISDNDLAGFEIRSKGELSLKTGSTYSNEGLKIYTSGQLKITQTPATGSASDSVLLRDSSGNVKQLPYSTSGFVPHINASGVDTYTATVAGVTAYNDADAYLVRFINGNTTGCTLNINGLGAKTLYRNNDGPLIGGDIVDGAEMLCIYNSTTGGFQVIGTAPNTLLSYVTNVDTVTLTKGMPVYAAGGTGDRMTVKRAKNTGDSTSAQTVGLVLSASIGVNQKGLIMMQGLLDGLNILPTSTWNDGDAVYLGATDGSITKIKPYAPNHLVYLGFVTTASNGSAGRMYVRVQNGYELDELHNVQAQSPTLKDTLWYDNTVSPAQWKTGSISSILGYTPANIAGDNFTGNIDAPSMSINGTDLESLMIAYAIALG